MKITLTPIVDCYRTRTKTYLDERGSFQETFNNNVLDEVIGTFEVKQSNLSHSDRGVLRGLHFQMGIHSQAKLITIIRGQVLDVVVDCRVDSKTYGKVATFILDGMVEKEGLFIPKGCAHGFLALRNDTIFSYHCDEFYNKESESGIVWNDSTLDIDWMIDENDLVISEKDAILPNWENSYKFDNV